MTELGKQIFKLRSKGLSYREIAEAIPCSRSSVHYVLTKGAKQQVVVRNRERRRRLAKDLKMAYGGACAVCGYNKCIQALEFDHLDPSTKKAHISVIRGHKQKSTEEAEKCILLCCRCHRERHAGLIDIGAYLEPTL